LRAGLKPELGDNAGSPVAHFLASSSCKLHAAYPMAEARACAASVFVSEKSRFFEAI
jgi:hypothetical protein